MTQEPAAVTPPEEVTGTETEAVTNGCSETVNGSAAEETAVVNGCDGDKMEVTAVDTEIKVRRISVARSLSAAFLSNSPTTFPGRTLWEVTEPGFSVVVFNLCYLYFLFKMDFSVLFCLV